MPPISAGKIVKEPAMIDGERRRKDENFLREKIQVGEELSWLWAMTKPGRWGRLPGRGSQG